MEIFWANTLEAVTAIATRVVIVLVEPASSGAAGGFGDAVGEDEDEDEAIIRELLGFVSEIRRDFEEIADLGFESETIEGL